jgi:hypothetical protein
MSFLLEYIKILLEKRAPFNPIAIKNKDPEELLAYVKRYQYIDQGSSRRVYFISPGKVLKVARSKKGIAQNKAEIDIFKKVSNKEYFTQIYDHDPSNLWILAESAREITQAEFSKLTGIKAAEFENITRTVDMLGFDDARMSLGKYIMNKFVTDTIDIMQKTKLNYGDLHTGHYGKCKDGRIALFDYGFTEEVNKEYYENGGPPAEEDFGTQAKRARCKHENISYDETKVARYKCDDCDKESYWTPKNFKPDCKHTVTKSFSRTKLHFDNNEMGYYNVRCAECGRDTEKYITVGLLNKYFSNVKLINVDIDYRRTVEGQLNRYTYSVNGRNYEIFARTDDIAAAKMFEIVDPTGEFLNELYS